VLDLSDTIVPKSDQLNSDDLRSGPRTFTIAEVRKNNSDEQPVSIVLAEFPTGRPWKPSKSMRRVLVEVWGRDASTYAGKRLTLYRDDRIKFGGQEVGGIRIQAMSGLKKPKPMALHVTRGKYESIVVQPLADNAPTSPTVSEEAVAYMADARAAKTLDEWRKVWQRAKDAGHLTDALKAELMPLGEALKAKPVDDEPPADFQGELYTPDAES
jgi:hypothetical protein